jgi:kynurenine formamidase
MGREYLTNMKNINRQHEHFSTYTLIDLTHVLNSNVPTWDGSCGFKNLITGDYSESLTHTKFQFQCLEMRAGIGTHMDAPCHCIKGGISIADIALKQLVLPLIVIDVSSHAHANYEISVNDIITFEKTHGIIPSGSLVIGYTGWSKYWNDPIQYRTADENGQVHFPSFNHKAAEILLDRDISGIAIDTLSPDIGVDGYFPVHELFLGAGKYLIENVANAHLLPSIGAYGIVLPLKLFEGAEAPVRFIAFV